MPTNIEIRNISEINPDSIVLSRGPGLFSHEAVNYFIDSSEAVVLTPKARPEKIQPQTPAPQS
jgi:carbamoylphosphate synthase small subunit